MSKKAELTIILPNYNSQLYLKKTLQSITSQSYQKWNLIIVDDNSNVETKKILNKFGKHRKIKIFYLKVNRGAAYCRNFALKKIKSKYVAFIDSDDIWVKNKLKLQVDFMKKNQYAFTYTCYETFGEKRRKIYPPDRINYKNFLKNTSIATSTMILSKKIIKGAKFTDTKICEDYFF
jgi:teichuronic acid biosynthesis glycosyltransferase TuaG